MLVVQNDLLTRLCDGLDTLNSNVARMVGQHANSTEDLFGDGSESEESDEGDEVSGEEVRKLWKEMSTLYGPKHAHTTWKQMTMGEGDAPIGFGLYQEEEEGDDEVEEVVMTK